MISFNFLDMIKFDRIFLVILAHIFSIVLNLSTPASGMERPGVEHTPHGKQAYGGAIHTAPIESVKVSSCVTLGGGCIDKINKVLKDANQFVVSFMYRFDSPTLTRTLEDKYLESIMKEAPIPVLVFLDYSQIYKDSFKGAQYYNYVQRLIEAVPTSVVKLGNRSFHHKIMIAKSAGEQAITIIGSANATFESDNMHSDDLVFIQSNEVANFFLNAFKDLLRSEPTPKPSAELREKNVQIFHEHRLVEGKSNIKVLFDILGEEEEERKGAGNESILKTDDQMTMKNWYNGSIVALALSTGHPEMEGTQKCAEVVNNALMAPNKALFLFENYISLDPTNDLFNLLQNLKSKTPKLIVLDDNIHNKATSKEKEIKQKQEKETIAGSSSRRSHRKELPEESQELASLKTKHNEILFFQPFTGKKFHHKLIIQFPKNRMPIVYTGSFHLSSNAIKNNSENIIGIQSEELADDYLASLLLNSGLGEQVKIWKFIYDHPHLIKRQILDFEQEKPIKRKVLETKIIQAARQLLLKTEIQMARYKDRLERIETIITGAVSDEEVQPLKELFQRCLVALNEDYQDQTPIEDLKNNLFDDEDIYPIWDRFLRKIYQNIKNTTDQPFIHELPSYSPENKDLWLTEMKDWLDAERDTYKEKQNKNNILLIEDLWRALNNLNGYNDRFAELQDLSEILMRVIGKLTS